MSVIVITSSLTLLVYTQFDNLYIIDIHLQQTI